LLDALPLLPNGNLNRLALPDPGNCTLWIRLAFTTTS